MSDLVSRLLAAIEETEQYARDAAARSAEWSVADHVTPPWGEEPPDDDVILAAGKPIATMNTEYGGCLAAVHVAHNDPAAVLRRTSADREVVDTCAFWLHENDAGTDPCAAGVLRLLARSYGISVEEETAGGK